ncbi:flagellar protein FlaG [Clostridium sp. MB40-C1]|uniref:flagellar protein FlaG n=1 Tax=Clostridium sp. MB40-C1 TaxID=3070996 RepID=UPI0027DF03F3|nr:flagellar protein FlaG [Clostridium sp. MB40-C1]WMJ81305.1 flagellar protein FlaG [Clostridium sp. MB40-C1]
MVDPITGQGRQVNSVTMSNNFADVNNLTEQEVVQITVSRNQNIDKQMEHGKQDTIEHKQIKNAVDKLNKFLQGEATHIEYERHDKLKSEFVIKIIDNKTKEVIKEIPPKKILDMVAELCKLAGVIVDEKA